MNNILHRRNISARISLLVLLAFALTPLTLFAQIPGTWEKHTVCTHCTLPENVRFADSLNGFILSDGPPSYVKSNTYRTSDGGKSWTHISDTVSSVYFNAAFRNVPLFYDTSGLIVSYYVFGLCISTDTGRTWALRISPNGASLIDGFKTGPSTYYAFTRNYINGSSPHILVTHDTGKTFLPVSQTYQTQKTLESSAMYDTSSMWMTLWEHGDKRDELYHSTDKGNSWIVTYPVDTNWMGKFFSYTLERGSAPNKLFLVGTSGNTKPAYTMQILGENYDFLQTTDNGKTWGGSGENNGAIIILHNPRGNEVWTVMYYQHTIGYSPNNGTNWYYDSLTFRDDSIQNMIWQDSLHGYVLGYKDSTANLYIWTPATSIVNSISYFQGGTPFKIYPTITSDVVHLLSMKPLDGVLAIYDIFGRLVLKQNVIKQRGETTECSLSGFANGVYFVTFSSGGDLSAGRVIKE